MAQDELTMRAGVELACWSIAVAGSGLLALACVAELLRRRTRPYALVALSDRLLPTSTHRVAVAIVTLLSSALAIAGPRTALADSHVRDWLTGPTTSTTVPAAAPVRTSDERDVVDVPTAPNDSSVRDWLTAPESDLAPPETTTTTSTTTTAAGCTRTGRGRTGRSPAAGSHSRSIRGVPGRDRGRRGGCDRIDLRRRARRLPVVHRGAASSVPARRTAPSTAVGGRSMRPTEPRSGVTRTSSSRAACSRFPDSTPPPDPSKEPFS